MGATQLGVAVPNFWFAMILVFVFAIRLGWFSRAGSRGGQAGPLPALQGADAARHRSGAAAGGDPRAGHAVVADRHAGRGLHPHREGQGADPSQVLWRHGFRNALIPVLTILGLQFSFLIAGGIIIEQVFYIPGLGRLIFQAISSRDLITVQSVVMLLVFAVILVTFAVTWPTRPWTRG
jgi:peptide/nickel transport system permease protein